MGSRDAHWHENTFISELMTGLVNSGGMPLSRITVGGLADLGYTVNYFAADAYSTPAAIMANALRASPLLLAPAAERWERLNDLPLYSIDAGGVVRRVRDPQ